MFVASGCPCWDNGTAQPYTFGWQPNYTIEGKILGQYIKQHFAGKKVGVLYQDDDFGTGRPRGNQGRGAGEPTRLDAALPVGRRPTLAPQITAMKAAGAEVVVDFTVPIYTAIAPADVVHARLQTAAGRLERRASTRRPSAGC